MVTNILVEVFCLFLAALIILIFVFTGMPESFKKKYLNEEGIKKVKSINDKITSFVTGTIDLVVKGVIWFINLDKIEYSNKYVSLLGDGTREKNEKILCFPLKDIFDAPRFLNDNGQPFENYTEYKIKAILKSNEMTDVELIEEKTKNRIVKSLRDNVDGYANDSWVGVIYHPAISELSVFIINNEEGIKELEDKKSNKEDDDGDEFFDIFSEDCDFQKITLNFGYNYIDFIDWKGRVPIALPISSHCHMIITGSSGSGKSQSSLWLLNNIIETMPTDVNVCDFKNGNEWRFLREYPYFYAGEKCVDGIRKFYNQFKNSSCNDENFHLLLLDEYPALITFLTMQDKLNKSKLALEVQSMVSEILAMGRSLKYGIWILAQRPDASLFANGSRDNFMVQIALGNISREHRQMLFSGCDLPSEKIYKAGEGILYADGLGIREVKYPLLNDVDKWKMKILNKLMDGAIGDAEGIDE